MLASGLAGMKRALVTGGSGAIGARDLPRGSRADGCMSIVHAHSGAGRGRSGRRGRSCAAAARPRPSPSTSPTAQRRSAALDAPAGRRADPDPRQQRRHPRRRGVPGHARASSGRASIDVSLNGFFNVTQPLLMPMIAHALGPHRQHLLGRGASSAIAARPTTRPPRRRCTARRESLALELGEPRHHGQRGRARHHRVADDRRGLSTRRRSTGWCR